MEDKQNVGGRDRIVRALLTAFLSIVAVRSLRRGKRLRGLLAGVGALGVGFTATTGHCGVNEALGVDTTGDTEDDVAPPEPRTTSDDEETAGTTSKTHSLHCAECGEPIVPGESRGPNDDDEIVHDACE